MCSHEHTAFLPLFMRLPSPEHAPPPRPDAKAAHAARQGRARQVHERISRCMAPRRREGDGQGGKQCVPMNILPSSTLSSSVFLSVILVYGATRRCGVAFCRHGTAARALCTPGGHVVVR